MGKLKISTVLLLALTIGYAFSAYAEPNKNESRQQSLKIMEAAQQIDSIQQDIESIQKSIELLAHYHGLWPRNQESLQWAQSQREFVCSGSKKLREHLRLIESRLHHFIENPATHIITERATIQLKRIKTLQALPILATNQPCKKATILAKKYSP